MKFTKIFTTTAATLALLMWLGNPALAGDIHAKPDGTWVSLTGKVTETTLDGFHLDYGDGKIIVEMDDWDAYDESKQLNEGERVKVYGNIDDGFFEARTIEASTVYVFDRNVYYHASSFDEEGDMRYYSYVNVFPTIQEDQWLHVTGVIQNVDGREFTLDMGTMDMTVDTDEMVYNPLDDEGYQMLEIGDRVSVWGQMDYDLFEARELKAKTIITLDENIDVSSLGS